MSYAAIGSRSGRAPVTWLTGALVRLLPLASIFGLFAVSDMMLHDWGFKYGDAGGNALQKLHPSTWLALLSLIATAAIQGKPLLLIGEFLKSRAVVIYILGLAILFAFTIQIRSSPFTPWIDTFVLPLLLYVMIPNMSRVDKRRAALIIHVLMNANALLGLYEAQTGYRLTTFVAGDVIITEDWRSTALLGHPLANALASGTYVLALATGGGRDLPKWLTPLVIGLQLLGMTAFGGRTSLVLTLLILTLLGVFHLAMFLRDARVNPLSASLFFLTLPAVTGVLTLAISGGFFDRLVGRFIDDNGSASARISMLQMFDYFSWEGIIFGPDPSLVSPLQYLLGIEYGIESFWIGFIVQNGLVVSFLFFIALGAFSWRLAFVTSSSVSMSSKTCAFAIFTATALILMRTDRADAPKRVALPAGARRQLKPR
jgi:hypothetical protein